MPAAAIRMQHHQQHTLRSPHPRADSASVHSCHSLSVAEIHLNRTVEPKFGGFLVLLGFVEVQPVVIY